jgi:hypothetical protein
MKLKAFFLSVQLTFGSGMKTKALPMRHIGRMSISSLNTTPKNGEMAARSVVSHPYYSIDSIQMPSNRDIDGLLDFFSLKKNILAITGAGISTPSGIPDYRGPQGSYKKGHKPILHDEFVRNESARKRYWTRSMAGWKEFSKAQPNAAHFALARLEARGALSHIVTQNVDRLHQSAGSLSVTDLHGRNDRVVCLSCQTQYSRRIVQEQLQSLNRRILPKIHEAYEASRMAKLEDASLRPDGDVEMGDFSYNEVSEAYILISSLILSYFFFLYLLLLF